jgi:hypothetical protein
MMVRLSGSSKDKYGIDAEAYLELHKKYQEGLRRIIDVRTLGGIVYKGLISASALAAAIGTLNIFSFLLTSEVRVLPPTGIHLNSIAESQLMGGENRLWKISSDLERPYTVLILVRRH